MTKEQAIQILNNAAATKGDMRSALSFALGVEAKPKKAASTPEEKALFNACKDVFMNQYRAYTGIGYSFSAKDGGALKMLLKKIELDNRENDTLTNDEPLQAVFETFAALLTNMPEDYKLKFFSLALINSKYNELKVAIRKHGKKDQGVSDDYLRRKLDILNS